MVLTYLMLDPVSLSWSDKYSVILFYAWLSVLSYVVTNQWYLI